jgi:hypothetical protein
MTQNPANPMQLPLGVDYRATVDAAGQKLLVTVAEAIGSSGKQWDDFANNIGVDPGQLSRALSGRGVHFSVRWLPAIIWRDTEHRIVKHLCAMAGGAFVERPRLTAEEKVALLEKTLRDSGPYGEAVLRAAYGEAP